MANATNFDTPMARFHIKRILELIKDRAMTVQEIGAALRLCASEAARFKRHLHDNSHKRIYIEKWARSTGTGGSPKPYYRAGSEKDAPKPRPFTRVERTRRHLKAVMKDPVRSLELKLYKKRWDANKKRKIRKAAKVTVDPMSAWINKSYVVESLEPTVKVVKLNQTGERHE